MPAIRLALPAPLRALLARGSGSAVVSGFLVVAVLTMVGKIVAFAKDALVADKLGTASELDAYMLVFGFYTFIASVLGGGVPESFVPAYAELRAAHPSTMEGSRDKLFWFLCGWLGGPDYFVERFGHPRLRARHMPFRIGIKERDQWLACMFQAMQECQVDEALQQRLAESFAGTADWMRNVGG